VNELTDAEKGYIAGIIDGEGCISISHHLRGHSSPQIKVKMTNHNCLLWCYQKTSLGRFYPYKLGPAYKFNKQPYVWIVTKLDEILSLLKLIEPYLIVKKKQAALMVEFVSMKRELSTSRKKHLDKLFRHEESLKFHSQMKVLNGSE
jgi:hypothetical protein